MRAVLALCLLLVVVNVSNAQVCRKAKNPGNCKGPSSTIMQQISIATAQAYGDVLSDVNVNSQYTGSSKCAGGVTCKINESAQKARAKALAPAEAFAAVARDVAEWYLESVGEGCPNARILANYVTILTRWADKDGFLGKVSPQGVFEVDWKIVTIAAGYMKMKPYLSQDVKSKTEGWISKLYSTTAGRQADSNNNHYIWHHAALTYASMALGRDSQIKSAVGAIIKHMQQYITPDGVITTEPRCTKTLHYHYFYMEAALGSVAAHKYYFGQMPDGWDSVSSRVAAVLDNINNPSKGAQVVAKRFGYGGAVKGCKPSSIQKVASRNLQAVNAFFAAVSAGNGQLAPCDADSSYFGKLRWLPVKGVNMPLNKVCC